MPQRDYDRVELVGKLREGYSVLIFLDSQVGYSEADTRTQLIDPLIELLYDSSRVREEVSDSGNRPDYVLYVDPITEGGPARVIAEAKPMGTDFDHPSGDRTELPHRQVQRYLRDHAAGTQSTIGALTDGLHWRLYRRDFKGGVEVDAEFDLGPLVRGENESLDLLSRLLDVLGPTAGRQRAGSAGERALRALAAAIRPERDAPVEALRVLGAVSEPYAPIGPDALAGRDRDQALTDWDAYAHGDGLAIPIGEGEQASFHSPRVRLAAVRFAYSEHGIGRADAARCARIFAAQTESRVAVAFVWQSDDQTGLVKARLVVALGRRVAMTQLFDLDLPSPTAREATMRTLDLLSGEEVKPEKLVAPLDVLPLQRSFYEEIRAWVRCLRGDYSAFPGSTDKETRHKILLRHLIRTLFVWILKEEGRIPSVLFERRFVQDHGNGDYHDTVLRFLFHKRLNTEMRDRGAHPIEAVSAKFANVPFLNGSLFEPRDGDEQLSIAEAHYWSDNENKPGLFDVLARYHWTADEQRPGEREQTLDPELLSNLFEQLLADPALETQAEGETLKAPEGAYYTPMDVTAEMAADALAAAVRKQAPAAFSDEALLDLFRDPDAELPDLSDSASARLLRRIEELRIFDPAVGSGAFLLAVLQALRTALSKLHLDSSDPTRTIITNQLMGQDINPLAAQIARLRLFIALQHAERTEVESAPLPNLEARIVCADTLFTHPGGEYDPFARGAASTLASADIDMRSALENALRTLAAVREQWPNDHTEPVKRKRRSTDRQAREDLRRYLDDASLLHPGAARELRALADYPLLEVNHDEPARIDPRLLFAQDEGQWQGFDVVIGNPPYQSFGQSGIGEAERRTLEERGYRTTNATDLYTLFCESALALARQDGGVVTLVVPLSIAFGRQERNLRASFEDHCRSVTTRHYDNIPDTIFNQHPLFKYWKNKQRATIVTAVRGEGPPALRTDTLLRWRVHDREDVLRRRSGVLPGEGAELPGRQWPRIPNEAVAEMLRAITRQRTSIDSLRAQATAVDEACGLSLPPTGWYFVSALPPGTRNPSRQSLLALPDEETRTLVMAALNGHVAYGWWRVFGDGFHVKLSDYAAFTIPNAWLEGDKLAQALVLGQELIEAITSSRKDKWNAGQKWPNVDFFEFQPDLIDKLDRFHVESLGLNAKALLPHLRRMRSPDGWDFG